MIRTIKEIEIARNSIRKGGTFGIRVNVYGNCGKT